MKTATIKHSGEPDARPDGHRTAGETSTSVRVSPSVLMDAGCRRDFPNELGNQGDCCAENSAPALRGVHSFSGYAADVSIVHSVWSTGAHGSGHSVEERRPPHSGREKGPPKLLKTSNIQEHGEPSGIAWFPRRVGQAQNPGFCFPRSSRTSLTHVLTRVTADGDREAIALLGEDTRSHPGEGDVMGSRTWWLDTGSFCRLTRTSC